MEIYMDEEGGGEGGGGENNEYIIEVRFNGSSS